MNTLERRGMRAICCCLVSLLLLAAQQQIVDPDFKVSVAGRAQGLAMTFGRGKVVAPGEAGMFSAQVVRFADGREVKFGLNVPGNNNHQFALNVLHWLSGLLD